MIERGWEEKDDMRAFMEKEHDRKLNKWRKERALALEPDPLSMKSEELSVIEEEPEVNEVSYRLATPQRKNTLNSN